MSDDGRQKDGMELEEITSEPGESKDVENKDDQPAAAAKGGADDEVAVVSDPDAPPPPTPIGDEPEHPGTVSSVVEPPSEQPEPKAIGAPLSPDEKRMLLLSRFDHFRPTKDLGTAEAGAVVQLTETKENGWDVKHVEIEVGDTVCWRWFSSQNVVQMDGTAGGCCSKPITAQTQREGGIRSGPCQQGACYANVFHESGTYHFGSEGGTDGMTSVVVVRPTKFRLLRRLTGTGLVVFGFAGVTTACILYTASFVRDEGFLLDDAGDTNTAQYRGRKALHDDFLDEAAPWFVAALWLAIVGMMQYVAQCCQGCIGQRFKDFGRGFTLGQQAVSRVFLCLVVTSMFALVVYYWHLLLFVNHSITNVFTVISRSTVDVINEILASIDSLQFIISNGESLVKGFKLPASTMSTLADLQQKSSDAKSYAKNGDEIVSAVFRIFSVLMFLGIQLGVTTVAAGLTAAYRKRPKMCKSARNFGFVSLVFVCMTVGLHELMLLLFDRTSIFIEGFVNKSLTITEVQELTGLGNNSGLIDVVTTCQGAEIPSIDVMETGLRSSATETNNLLRSIPEPFFTDLGMTTYLMVLPNISLNTTTGLNAYADAMGPQIVRLRTLTENPLFDPILPPQIGNQTLPVAAVSVSLMRSMANTLDCIITRDALARVLPIINDDILVDTRKQIRVQSAMVAMLVVLAVALVVGEYVFNRPWKLWYEQRTERWFRFRAAYKAHVAVLHKHGVPKSHQRYRDKCCSTLIFIQEMYLWNVVMSLLVIMQALMLVVLHNSTKDNELPEEVKSAAMLSILGPCINIFTSTAGWSRVFRNETVAKWLKRLFRLLAVGCFLSAMATLFTKSSDSIDRGRTCWDKLQEQRRNDDDGAVAYPSIDGCQLGAVVKDLELAVYYCVMAVVLALALVPGAFMICFQHKAFTSGDHIFEKRVANKAGFVAAWRRWRTCGQQLLLFLAFVVLLACAFSYFYSDPSHDGDRAEKIEADFIPKWQQGGCNGKLSLCDRRVDEITLVGAHHSPSYLESHWAAASQYYGLGDSFKFGIRATSLSAWTNGSDPGVPYTCGALCGYGSTPITQSIQNVTDFLEANSSAIVLLLIEQHSDTASLVNALQPLAGMAWSHPSGLTPLDADFVWPTMRELVDAGKRLLLFTTKPTPRTPNRFRIGDAATVTAGAHSGQTVTVTASPAVADATKVTVRTSGGMEVDVRPGTELVPTDEALAATPEWMLYAWDFLSETANEVVSQQSLSCNIVPARDKAQVLQAVTPAVAQAAMQTLVGSTVGGVEVTNVESVTKITGADGADALEAKVVLSTPPDQLPEGYEDQFKSVMAARVGVDETQIYDVQFTGVTVPGRRAAELAVATQASFKIRSPESVPVSERSISQLAQLLAEAPASGLLAQGLAALAGGDIRAPASIALLREADLTRGALVESPIGKSLFAFADSPALKGEINKVLPPIIKDTFDTPSELYSFEDIMQSPAAKDLLPFQLPAKRTGAHQKEMERRAQIMREEMRHARPLAGRPHPRKLAVMNHYLSSPGPSPSLALAMNSRATFSARQRLCGEAWGRFPNVVFVDFISLGEVREVVIRDQSGVAALVTLAAAI